MWDMFRLLLRHREAALFGLVEGLLGKNTEGCCRNVQSADNGLALMDGGSEEPAVRMQMFIST